MNDRISSVPREQGVAKQQHLQEDEYRFPYHWIPEWGDVGYRPHRVLSWAYEYVSYASFVIEIVKSIRPRHVLDIGCGDGRLTFEMSRVLGGTEVVGLDYSKRAIDLARAMRPELRWVCGDISSVRFDRKFDVATLVEVLEHIPPFTLDSFLDGAREKLKAEGFLVLSVPSANQPVTTKHFQHFNDVSLRSVLRGRFDVQEIWYLNAIPGRAARLFLTLLCNRWFLVTHSGVLRRFYGYYIKKMLIAPPDKATRLVVKCRVAGGD